MTQIDNSVALLPIRLLNKTCSCQQVLTAGTPVRIVTAVIRQNGLSNDSTLAMPRLDFLVVFLCFLPFRVSLLYACLQSEQLKHVFNKVNR